MIEASLLIFFPCLVAYAATSDLFTMTIPNRVSLLLIAGFAALAPFVPLTLPDVGYHLLAGACVFAVGFAFFAFGWMGGGDVKVAAAIALWLGFSVSLFDFLFLSALFGAVLTLALLLFRENIPVLPGFASGQAWLVRLHDRNSGIPYGIALSLAALQVYPETVWFKALLAAT
ncbi:prepilin peptidase [Rhizobiales bacterium]|uniref:A24 family peptidase n=1 Tax=Hongsoonwoonella zoysiae TaxID=2821844 RepID=UPI00155F7387|nr:prepilin peptidase [Hongsoonwoonella zoysiae]NRG16136.1 prepilin peptidase [Hongsoonwoonella zoysiae]